MIENTSFLHDCRQQIFVVGWTHGYWRRPNLDEDLCGALALKGGRCTCGELIKSDEASAKEIVGETLDGRLF